VRKGAGQLLADVSACHISRRIDCIYIYSYNYICIYMVREGAGQLLADVSACHSL